MLENSLIYCLNYNHVHFTNQQSHHQQQDDENNQQQNPSSKNHYDESEQDKVFPFIQLID